MRRDPRRTSRLVWPPSPGSQPPLNELCHALADITREITLHGVFNYLLSNGQALFSHCSTRLYYIVRQWPFSTAHLIDADLSIDFAQVTTPDDRVAVIATAPLTDNETWTAFAPGELTMFEEGRAIGVLERVRARQPDDVRREQREHEVASRVVRHGAGEERDEPSAQRPATPRRWYPESNGVPV